MIILPEKQLIKVSTCLWLKYIFWQTKNRREFFFNLTGDSYKIPTADAMEISRALLLRLGIGQAWEQSPLLVSLPPLCYLPAELKPNYVLKDKGFHFFLPFEVIHKQFHFLLLSQFTHYLSFINWIQRVRLSLLMMFSSLPCVQLHICIEMSTRLESRNNFIFVILNK